MANSINKVIQKFTKIMGYEIFLSINGNCRTMRRETLYVNLIGKSFLSYNNCVKQTPPTPASSHQINTRFNVTKQCYINAWYKKINFPYPDDDNNIYIFSPEHKLNCKKFS